MPFNFMKLLTGMANPATGAAFNLTAGAINLFGRAGGSYDYYATSKPAFEAAQKAQQQAFDEEARLQDAQAELILNETIADIQQKAREVAIFQGDQTMKYNDSGVIVSSGSPLVVLDHTRSLATQELEAMSRRGSALYDLAKRRADLGRRQGRASLIGQSNQYALNRANARASSYRPGSVASLMSDLLGGANPYARAYATPSSYVPGGVP